MNVSDLIMVLRKRTKTTPTMMSDADMMPLINLHYKKIRRKLVNTDKNMFWESRTSDIVAGQNEYDLLDPSGTTFGMGPIEKISAKYNTDQDCFKGLEIKDWDHFRDEDLCEYEKCQPSSCPFAIITDNHIRIYPTPTETVIGGLKIEGARKPYDLTATSTEDDIIIPDEYADLLALAMTEEIYKCRNLIQEKNDARKEYRETLNDMLRDIVIQKTTPVYSSTNMPDLTCFH